MSVRKQRMELCTECGAQVFVSKNFKGKKILCKDCRNVDHTHDKYESEEDEYFALCKDAEEDPWDVIDEDSLDLPPISSVVRLKDWVVRLDIRGSARLTHYDRSAQVAAAPQAAAATESTSVASSLT